MKEIRQTMLVAAGVAAALQVVMHFYPAAPADARAPLAGPAGHAIARR